MAQIDQTTYPDDPTKLPPGEALILMLIISLGLWDILWTIAASL